ncbi:LysR family transcriptional regulator [Sphaerotilus sp.]|uniref:LysR family transcriptional regulator n=1 Tax=Sphaerotilus sp. TaxID=2093942 RepID=UPI0034E2EE7C
MSRVVSELQKRLGVRLLQRTTRRLSPTSEGALFHERCKDLLSELTQHTQARSLANCGSARRCPSGSCSSRPCGPLSWPGIRAWCST